jgi:hypothetical protein
MAYSLSFFYIVSMPVPPVKRIYFLFVYAGCFLLILLFLQKIIDYWFGLWQAIKDGGLNEA